MDYSISSEFVSDFQNVTSYQSTRLLAILFTSFFQLILKEEKNFIYETSTLGWWDYLIVLNYNVKCVYIILLHLNQSYLLHQNLIVHKDN